MDSGSAIRVFAPATVANVGCGYDVLGLALDTYGDILQLSKRDDHKLIIQSIKGATDLPFLATENVATVAIQAMLEVLDIQQGFDLIIEKNIAPGSGLGSSASSSAAAVFAANELLGHPFTKKELVAFAMEGERSASGVAHADNVAPALLGGFTVIRGYDPLDVFNIPYPDDLFVTIFFPQVTIKTSDAKRILKRQIDLKDAVTQWGNVAGLVAGLILKDHELIKRSLQDVIVEPIRSILIPLYQDVKQICMDAGAIGFNISGSGPSMFALTNSKTTAQEMIQKVSDLYKSQDISLFSFVSSINSKGAVVI